jgi:hypothetical protein
MIDLGILFQGVDEIEAVDIRQTSDNVDSRFFDALKNSYGTVLCIHSAH